MKTIVVSAFLILLSFQSCDKKESGRDSKWLNNIYALLEHNLEKVSIEEGLAGTVIFTEGNCMPGVVDEEGVEGRCLRYPVNRVVHIHEYTHRSETKHLQGGFHINVETELVSKVEADTEGFFEVALPPGEYSLFIAEKGILYANLWNGKGYIQPATVTEGDTTFKTLEITHSAYY